MYQQISAKYKIQNWDSFLSFSSHFPSFQSSPSHFSSKEFCRTFFQLPHLTSRWNACRHHHLASYQSSFNRKKFLSKTFHIKILFNHRHLSKRDLSSKFLQQKSIPIFHIKVKCMSNHLHLSSYQSSFSRQTFLSLTSKWNAFFPLIIIFLFVKDPSTVKYFHPQHLSSRWNANIIVCLLIIVLFKQRRRKKFLPPTFHIKRWDTCRQRRRWICDPLSLVS